MPPQPALRLDPAKVHAWRVERQLLGKAKAASPAEVATTLIGVQAQVVSSAALVDRPALEAGPREVPGGGGDGEGPR